jgi:Rrf2 family transcriptional regulator, iron-sulfur cluster assembly transcription factor
MKISTKGRYALRVMIDLAEHNTGEFIPLSDIARRQEISEKYLESIVAVLSRRKFLAALRGKGGGYRLARAPESYTVGSILRLTEGSLAPVACLEEHPNTCPRAPYCKTLGMWTQFYQTIDRFFEGITLADLVRQNADVGFYSI